MTLIELVFDYVDPGSYLADRVLRSWSASASTEVTLALSPLELRTPAMPHLDAASPAWTELTRRVAAEAAREEVPFRVPGFVPWTRKAHELALHAREKDCFDAVHESIFEAHFVRGLDIGRVDVLASLAEECGLDRGEARTVLGVDRFLPEVERLRFMALDARLGGVPTIEAGGRRLEGFESADALRKFLEGLS